MRKVRYSLVLVGKTARKDKQKLGGTEPYTNAELLDLVKLDVEEHFGIRPVFVMDEELLPHKYKYPNFYAAGWFVSDETISNEPGMGSELVVVGHADTMEAAKKILLDKANSLDWENLAKTIGVE